MINEKKITLGNPIEIKQASLKDVFDEKLSSKLEKETKNIFLSNFFQDTNWKTMDVRGNGLCLFYAFMATDKEKYLCSIDDDVIEGFSEMVVNGIENYYKAIDEHEKNRITLPQDLQADIILDIIENEDIFVYKETFKENKNGLKTTITNLLKSNRIENLPIIMNKILAYANTRNIIQITYRNTNIQEKQMIEGEEKVVNITIPTLNFVLFPCYTGVDKDSKKYPEYETTILFLFNGHYFTIFHSDKEIKKKTIDLFKKIVSFNGGDRITFQYDLKEKKFKFTSKLKSIILDDAINEAKAAIIEEDKDVKDVKEVKEVKPEKTLVQILLKKDIVNYFKERKERNRIKDEKGGE
jgi:hypothetical protein